jgi:MoxR-like ATPase
MYNYIGNKLGFFNSSLGPMNEGEIDVHQLEKWYAFKNYEINDDNIYDLVEAYTNNSNELPNELKGYPIGGWNVSKVTNMNELFEECTSFNEPLNNWNVSNVMDMTNMFYGCSAFNQPLNNWNVSNVMDMTNMFYGCSAFKSNFV